MKLEGNIGCPHVLLPKIQKTTDEIIALDAKHRPRGWFIMFEKHNYPTMVCPQCGEISDLSQHRIDDRGVCAPSLVCPNDKKGCKFHVFAKLEDWQPINGHKLQELALRDLANAEDVVVAAMAYEILELRVKAAEQETNSFKDLVVYACIGENLGYDIANTFNIPIRKVKRWALGQEQPNPTKIDQVIRIIQNMIKEKDK